ncbi:unnamed protein product [Mytilus edulis]|uniref:C2H2-type domain-containing protein n=1 Tax=Mytilus edulis TaxID=6550 RepID=A0A8S3UFI1_MYTED|nr:unnamed protein product [Mytilus edulis]
MTSNILNAKAPNSKRGDAYECVRCQTSKAVINSYKHVVNHIRKQHLLATQCPYWCTLCDYRCDTQEELAKHVDTYPVHKKIVGIQETSGITINPDSFCGHSDMPYFISSDDIVAFNKEKSEEHYSQKRMETKNKTWLPHMPKQLKVTQHNHMMTQ